MKFKFLVLVIFMSIFSLESSAAAAVLGGVNWHKGSVEEALKEAKDSKKPVLLYWGAVWCPPCNALKATVFLDKDFIKATREYVMIYLDGDTKDAQMWGDKLKTGSYPTLLVINSDMEEIQRLPIDSTAKGYADELLRIKKDLQSFPEEVAAALKLDSKEITEKFWHKLENYPWEVDPIWLEDKKGLLKNIQALSLKVPNSLPETKVALDFQIIKMRAETATDEDKISDAERSAAKELLTSILRDEKKRQTHFYRIISSPSSLLSFIYPKPESEPVNVTRFTMEYRDVLWKMARTKTVEDLDRLNIYYGIVSLSAGANVNYPVLSLKERKTIKADFVSQLKATKDEHKIHVILNNLSSIYKWMGDIEEGRAIIVKQLKVLKDVNETYLVLADYDLAEGKVDSSLAWTKKAYEAARMGATRTQWGYIYLRTLIETYPERQAEIWNQSQKIIEEGLSYSDSFHGRNIRSLKRIRKGLLEWSEKNKFALNNELLSKIEKGQCTGFDDNFQTNCKAYLSEYTINPSVKK